jgi:hypothetical protein
LDRPGPFVFLRWFSGPSLNERTTVKNRRSTAIKPRNPLVAAARFRQAGAHARRDGSRQAAQTRLRKEVNDLKLDS